MRRRMMLSGAQAAALDRQLMAQPGFSLDQLMELAGLSVAAAAARAYPRADFPGEPLVVAGPGNNGGDALVAARHLWHFGFRPRVCYPKPRFPALVAQLEALEVPFLEAVSAEDAAGASFVVDGVFGFSFDPAGGVRAPFDAVLGALAASERLLAVDVPSGWHVEEGPLLEPSLAPDVLVSLSAPKLCAAHFAGRLHFLGGRFVPPALAAQFGIDVGGYEGAEQVALLEPRGDSA